LATSLSTDLLTDLREIVVEVTIFLLKKLDKNIRLFKSKTGERLALNLCLFERKDNIGRKVGFEPTLDSITSHRFTIKLYSPFLVQIQKNWV